MVYVNGLGYIDESIYNNTNTNKATSSSNAFDNLVSSLTSQATSNTSTTLNTGSTTLDDIFDKAASTYNIDVNLLKAVAKAESDFNPNATSGAGAQGIMQLMPSTAKYLEVTDSYDAEQNIMGGAKYLRELLDTFNGDTSLAVAAYNAGPGAVKKYDGIPPYTETENYVSKVLGYINDGVTVPSTVVNTAGNSSSNQVTSMSTSSEYDPTVLTFATEQYLNTLEIQQDALNTLFESDSDDDDSNNDTSNDLTTLATALTKLQAQAQSYTINNSTIDII